MKAISSDKPLELHEHDKFGYSDFAKLLAKAIINIQNPSGIVIGLYGSWGQGKSTTLNFIEQHLKNNKTSKASIVIVRFNPWWFSGQDALLQAFLTQLLVALEHDDIIKGKIGEFIKEYSFFIGACLDSMTGIIGTGAKIIDIAGNAITPSKDIHQIKRSLNTALTSSDIKILIMIDDIDRLFPNEILQIFAVVKSLLDLDNMIYFLAFDADVVCKAIESQHGLCGRDYLEKIIQVPFELPKPTKASLGIMFQEQIDSILIDTPTEAMAMPPENYLANIVEQVSQFIHTPRDIIRFSNTLKVTYAAVRGEVNPADFIAIEALRVFAPQAYHFIFNQQDLVFRGWVNPEYHPNDPHNERIKVLQKAFYELFSKETGSLSEQTRSIAFELTMVVCFNGGLSDNFMHISPHSRKKYHIANPDYFQLYFQLFRHLV